MAEARDDRMQQREECGEGRDKEHVVVGLVRLR